MSTVAITHAVVQRQSRSSRLPIVLTLPLIFLACQGTFSFQSSGESNGGFLPGTLVSRDPGILGYVVIPGISYLIMTWFIVQKRRAIWALCKGHQLLSLLALFTICSAVWSQNPMRSAAYGFFYLSCTLFAYWISTQPQGEVMPLIAQAGVVVCLLGLLLILFFPEYGTAHDLRSAGAWRGLFVNRTGAARCLVFVLSPTLVPWQKRFIWPQVACGVFLFIMLVMAHAVSSFLVIAVYLAVLGLLRISRRLGSRLSLGLALSGMVAVSLAVGFLLAYPTDILRALGRDPTLTGRTEIWSALLNSILKQPFLGYGYSAFWQGANGESGQVIHATKWVFGYAHNGYIEIALQLGVIGFLLFIGTLLQALRNAWICFRNDRSGRCDWYIGLLAITVLYNVDEATVMWPNDLPSILYIVACCGLSKAATQIKQHNLYEGSFL